LQKVFEKYVFFALQNYSVSEKHSCIIKDGNTSAQSFLFHNNRKFPVKPDTVFELDGKAAMICDQKYKPSPSESDRYQVITHACSYGAKKAILILPASNDEQSSLTKIGQIYDESGIELFEYRINLEGDLPNEERLMAEKLVALSSTPSISVNARAGNEP
jgi:5-methylcytosine-specific restriction endonuclease McrBC regulatory subunit McrC